MVQKTIAHYLADLRLDLKDASTTWSDAELIRCVEKAVADYSRFNPRQMSKEITIDTEITAESFTTPAVSDTDYFVDNMDISASVSGATCTLAHVVPDMPRPVIVTLTDANTSITSFILIVKGYDSDYKYIEESFYLEGGLVQTGHQYFAQIKEIEIDVIAGNGASDALDVGTGAADGVYVQLANRTIQFDSDGISSMTRDTDYEMEYSRGRIAMKSGGSMTVSTAYSIAYNKSKVEIDLTSIISDLIRVERVEYPSGQVPQSHASIELWGNILTVTGGQESQAEISDEEHLVIKYLIPHSAPSTQSPGSVPPHLDTTIELAASAYALFMHALKYELQAVTSLTAVDTSLAASAQYSIRAIQVLAEAALALADTQLDTAIGTLMTKVGTALDAVATALASSETYLNNDYLTDGVAYINKLNDGINVPENYASYAQVLTSVGSALVAEAQVFAQEAAVRLSQSDAYREAGRAFVEQANSYISEIDRILQTCQLNYQNANGYLALAVQFRDEAIERRNEAWAIWASPNQIAPNYTLGSRGQPVQ
jgi:hypothetical protein